MQIDLLADYPHYIDSLAPAILEHWRFALPADTLEARKAKLRGHVSRKELPIAWVAHQGGEVYGTAALRVHDLDDRTDLTLWLGGVLVLPAHRGKGIGSAICLAVERHTASKGVRELFLFTLDKQRLYNRLGWHTVERTVWHGFRAEIMSKRLAD